MKDFHDDPRIGRYADVLMDRQFKRTFGSDKNKRLTELLLQALIPEHRIESIEFVTQEHINPFPAGKDARIDVECTDKDGTRFVVEMQLARQDAFYERAIFNSTFAVQQQVLRGAGHRYDFPPVYFIGILNFSIHRDSDQVLWRYNFREDASGELMSDKLQFLFLELPNCTNALTDKASELDKLCYTLRNMKTMQKAPENFDTEIISLLLKSSETITFEAEYKEKYISDMTTKEDIENQIRYARKEGQQAGIAEGREEGMAAGIERGKVEGIATGIEQEKLASARKMKALGADVSFICEVTGLSSEQVAAL